MKMKTVDKLRLILLVCFISLAYLVLFPRVDTEAERQRQLQRQDELWRMKQMQSINFDNVRWDGVLRYQNGRFEVDDHRNVHEEVEVFESQELPPDLELVEVDKDELKEIRESPRKQVDPWLPPFVPFNEETGGNNVFHQNDNQVHFIKEEEETKSLMFKPSGLKYLVDLQPMPLFRSDRCPENFKPDGDNTVYDTLVKCKHQSAYPPDVEQWYYTQVIQCAGHLSIYNREMAMLQDVILDKGHSAQLTQEVQPNYSDFGGKKYAADNADGMYHFELGFFKLYCPTSFNKISYAFRGRSLNHLSRWYYVTEEFTNPMAVDYVVTQVAIAMTRYKPNSLYYTMGEAYNAYLAMRFFNLSADNIVALTVDSHPYTPLNIIWSYLFHMSFDMGNINTRTHFNTMIWNTIGYQSHLLKTDLPSLGYVDEFSDFVMNRFGIMWKKPLDCNRLTITLILRRDTPSDTGGNPKKVCRKIDNEQQFWYDISDHFKLDQINGSQLELLPMKTQLLLMSNTDILIGMHGAGLTHALFLPKHAAVLELFPGYWTQPSEQYKAICRWRNLKYDSWTNTNPEQESQIKDTVAVDSKAIIEKITSIKNAMCPPAETEFKDWFKEFDGNLRPVRSDYSNGTGYGGKVRKRKFRRKSKSVQKLRAVDYSVDNTHDNIKGNSLNNFPSEYNGPTYRPEKNVKFHNGGTNMDQPLKKISKLSKNYKQQSHSFNQPAAIVNN